jgi:predicted Holliday junction resolvase-like endonuclease
VTKDKDVAKPAYVPRKIFLTFINDELSDKILQPTEKNEEKEKKHKDEMEKKREEEREKKINRSIENDRDFMRNKFKTVIQTHYDNMSFEPWQKKLFDGH